MRGLPVITCKVGKRGALEKWGQDTLGQDMKIGIVLHEEALKFDYLSWYFERNRLVAKKKVKIFLRTQTLPFVVWYQQKLIEIWNLQKNINICTINP